MKAVVSTESASTAAEDEPQQSPLTLVGRALALVEKEEHAPFDRSTWANALMRP